MAMPAGYTYHDGAYWTANGHGPYFVDSFGEIHLLGAGAPPVPPTVGTLPIINGTPTLGFAVTYTPAVIIGAASFTSRQWKLDGVAIPGEVNPTYTPVTGDVGKALSIQELWTGAGGTVSPTSAPVSVAGGGLPAVVLPPVYTMYPMVGVVQSYTQGTATGSPTPTRAIQWLRDGAAISGATAATYTPVAGDLGKLLSVKETWTNFTGSASATSAAALVTPAMAAAASHKYIDPTMAPDDNPGNPGVQYGEGAAYTPSFPLADGSAAPLGKIFSTCKRAYDDATGNGHRYYCRKGYYHDPESNIFFVSLFSRSDTLFSSYGPAAADAPILDGIAYLDTATGWTAHPSIPNAWNYSLAGVTQNNSVIGRLWVGRQNNGQLTSQRPLGTERRRAANIGALSLTNGSDDAGLWFITAGSPSVLTMLSGSASAPPIYWNGIGMIFNGLTAAPPRGLAFRNGASGNRVFDLWVQGTSFRPLTIGEMSVDSTCNNNAFVKVRVQSFMSEGVYLNGGSAVRKVTNTYMYDVFTRSQGSLLACEAGPVNDYGNADCFAFGSYVENVYGNKLTSSSYNVHTVFDPRIVAGVAVKGLYLSDISVTFNLGATDGRMFGGYVDGGFFKNFTCTKAPCKSQIGGKDFEIAFGTIDEMQPNKDPDNAYACLQIADFGNPSGVPTADNLSLHDIEIKLSNTPTTHGAVWFEAGGTPYSAANSVEVYNIRAVLSDVQALAVNASSASFPTPWANQNIHDNVVVNANLVGQNFSTTNAGAKPPTYTSRPLNGYFGASNNSVVAA